MCYALLRRTATFSRTGNPPSLSHTCCLPSGWEACREEDLNPPFSYTVWFIISPQILLFISFTFFIYTWSLLAGYITFSSASEDIRQPKRREIREQLSLSSQSVFPRLYVLYPPLQLPSQKAGMQTENQANQSRGTTSTGTVGTSLGHLSPDVTKVWR